MKVSLKHFPLRGTRVGSRWGVVVFDAAGEASLDVPEGDLPMLRALKWLVEPPAAPEPPPAPEPAPVEAPLPPPAPEATLNAAPSNAGPPPKPKKR